MRKFTVTVNGQDYDVVVKDGGAAAAAPAPVAAAPAAAPAPAPVAAAPAPAAAPKKAAPARAAAPKAADNGAVVAAIAAAIVAMGGGEIVSIRPAARSGWTSASRLAGVSGTQQF